MRTKQYDEIFAIVNEQIELKLSSLPIVPKFAPCYYCDKWDFAGNMEVHGYCLGPEYCHEECRRKADGKKVCPHCDGSGEIRNGGRSNH